MKNQVNIVVKKESHSRKTLSGIYNARRCQIKENSLLNKCVEDPRQRHSGMTTHFTTARRCTVRSVSPQFRYAEYSGRTGFTLIELLVVVLIIGILAAVAVPQYQKAVAKSRMAEALSVLPTLVRASKLYYLANGEYPTNMAELDVEIPAERLSNQWAYGKADNPHTYYYSLNRTDGSWAANAADENLPVLHLDNDGYWCLVPKNTWGINKSAIAESICKSIGIYAEAQTAAAGVPYYKIN